MLVLLNEPNVSGVILGLKMDDASRYGTLIQDAAGRLVGFEEKKPGPGLINAGIYLLRASVLNSFPMQRPLSFEQGVFPELVKGGTVLKACCVTAPFLDIGTPQSLAQAESFIRGSQRRSYETPLQEFVEDLRILGKIPEQ